MLLGGHEPLTDVVEGVRHRLEPEVLLDLPREGTRLLAGNGRPHELQVAVSQIGQHVVRETDARLGDPAAREPASRALGRVLRVLLEHPGNLLLDPERRRAPGVLDLRQTRREIVGGALAAHQDEFVERPGPGMGEHRLLRVFRRGVHEAHGVQRRRAPGPGVGAPRKGQERLVDPGLRVQALEGKNRAPVGAAMGIPDGRACRAWMVGDVGVGPVIVPLGGMHGLRAADLLRWLPEEAQGAAQAVTRHGGLGPQHTGERRDTEGRVGVGVTGGPGVQPLARRPVRNRLLGVLWHGVVLGVRSQDGPALAERRQERRRHPGRAFLHLEPLGPQELKVGARRPVFPEGRLGVVPDLLVELRQPLLVRLDPVERGLLLAADTDHGDLLLRDSEPRRRATSRSRRRSA